MVGVRTDAELRRELSNSRDRTVSGAVSRIPRQSVQADTGAVQEGYRLHDWHTDCVCAVWTYNRRHAVLTRDRETDALHDSFADS